MNGPGAETTQGPTLAMAPLLTRILAGVVDVIVLALVFALVSAIVGDAPGAGEGIGSIEGPALLAYLAIVYLYYFAGEATSGATPGKRLTGIRVVSEDGSPAGAGQVGMRTILRLVDSLPGLYLVGIVVIVLTGDRRARIGDLAGRTAVIEERRRG